MRNRGLRRVTGIGTAGSLALALLAGGSVLAALAGPRQAQATGTRALRQTVQRIPPTDRTVVVSSNWATINDIIGVPTFLLGQGHALDLTPASLGDVTTQLRRDFSTNVLRLAPRPADWAGITPAPYPVTSPLPSLHGIPAKLEVVYRYPVASHLRLVAGTMPDTVRGSPDTGLQVVVTPRTASTFGLRPGSQLAISVPAQANPGQFTKVTLDVTGIAEPIDPGSSFWSTDPLLPGPSLEYQPGGGSTWTGGVIADPGESGLIQSAFGAAGLGIQWDLPVDAAALHGQAQALYNQVNQIANRTPQLTGRLAPMTNAMTASSGMLQPLAALIQAARSVNLLLWMVYVGLAVAGVVMLLLAARMIAARRYPELAVRQARGASLAQIFWFGFLGAAVVCGPAAAIAWAAAVALVPDSALAGPAAWWPGLAVLAIATAGPGAAAVWQHRPPRRGQAGQRRRRATRVVFEVTICAVAIGGITVFRTQTGTGDLYTSAAPVLVAAPAVIVVLRLYQLVLRGLARASARRRGVIGFLGLTRAAQATATLGLPAMTLVLAVTVAAFTGMVRDAVLHGETAASWQQTGADVTVTAPWALNTLSSLLGPSAVHAIAAVPGVQHAATAFIVPLRVGNGEEVTGIAVDPASYAALAASTQGFSPVNPALLSGPHGPGTIPVLASPQAAAYLGGQNGGSTTIASQQGLPPLPVRVAGELRSTPAMPSGGAFIVLPRAAIGSVSDQPPVNLMLLTGPSIDLTSLRTAVQAATRGGSTPVITSRSVALQGLAGAPLQQGTFLIFSLAVGYAAALALAVMLLELALGAADRELTMARLAAMGLTGGQRVRLAAFEVLPAIAASAVAAVSCAFALPQLVAPAITLSVFTQSQAQVPLRPDVASFVLPLAGVVAVTVVALVYQVRSGRGGRVATTMRAL